MLCCNILCAAVLPLWSSCMFSRAVEKRDEVYKWSTGSLSWCLAYSRALRCFETYFYQLFAIAAPLQSQYFRACWLLDQCKQQTDFWKNCEKFIGRTISNKVRNLMALFMLCLAFMQKFGIRWLAKLMEGWLAAIAFNSSPLWSCVTLPTIQQKGRSQIILGVTCAMDRL